VTTTLICGELAPRKHTSTDCNTGIPSTETGPEEILSRKTS
jgi:hypothetical protein